MTFGFNIPDPPIPPVAWNLRKSLGSQKTETETDISLFRCCCYDSTNNALFAGTDPKGQIWKSTDGGDTWTMMQDLSLHGTHPNNEISALCFDSTSNVLIAGCGYTSWGTGGDTDIFRSTDGGTTWNWAQTIVNEFDVQTLIHDPFNDTIVAATSSDALVWVSANEGVTWTNELDLAEEEPYNSLGYDSSRHRLIIASAGSWVTIYTSDDGGYNWTERQNFNSYGPGGFGTGSASTEPQYCHGIDYDVANDVIIAVMGSSSTGAQIWGSADGGVTWVMKKQFDTVGNGDPQFGHAVCYNADAGKIYVGLGDWFGGQDNNEIWVSADGGDTWTLDMDLDDNEIGWTYDMVYDSANNKQIMVGGFDQWTPSGVYGPGTIWNRDNGTY